MATPLVGLGVFLAGQAPVASTLTVSRSSDAGDCPDAAALSRTIQAMTPLAPVPAAATSDDDIRVAFTRDRSEPRTYRVEIRILGGVRDLASEGPGCASLSQATALTIALVLDPSATIPPEPTAAPEPTVPPPSAEVRRTTSKDWALAVEAGGGATFGFVRSVAPVVQLRAEARPRPFFGLEAAALLVPSQSLPLGQGTVDVSLVAARLGGCLFPIEVPAASLHAGACGGVLAGILAASGHGYADESATWRPLFGAMVQAVAGGRIAGPMGWAVAVGALLPFHRERFGIAGLGVAYEAPPVGGFSTLGITMTFR